MALWHSLFHNADRVVSAADDPDVVRLWSKVDLAELYRPHMILKPRTPPGPQVWYVVDATDAYLTLVDCSNFTLEVNVDTLHEYHATSSVDEFWVFNYCLGVFFAEEQAPTVVVDVTTEPHSLPHFIAITYAHLLTRDQLHLLLDEMGFTMPKSTNHLGLVMKLLDVLDIQGESRDNMVALAKGMQRKQYTKECSTEQERLFWADPTLRPRSNPARLPSTPPTQHPTQPPPAFNPASRPQLTPHCLSV